ncbi:hypothetical protein BCR36DRAFT_283940 [Piromyces finnis]|uniref:Rho-GAP domain-containing protein n=1 Tax=Piromyces finnis TaxID=1754191 RepID=A0A1Y1VFI3_9FUNG|nr:hypothetical protein BCR36DRAFT_283940 [Piromyces finnis]|eukprot:ORX53711.1 hypothetical protein BCR36DRAFT_283940 [Piromyces finnis]
MKSKLIYILLYITLKLAGNVNLKNEHNLHLVISVFMDFLRRMPGRIISKDIYNTFPIINEENRKIIKKIKKNLKKLPEQRYATLKYLINFFSGNCENSNSLKIELDSNEIASLAPVIASVIVEIPNDYTLSSKIYRNGNIINYISENNDIDNVKNRENLIRLMILNYKKLFTKNKKKSKSYNYSNKEYIEKDYYSKSYTVNDIPSSSPTKFHLRISSKQHSSPSSPVQTTYNSFSIDDKLYKYNTISNIRNEDLSFDNNSIYSNKNNFDISNLNCKFIDNKIYLTFSIATPDAKSQHYKLEIPSSGTGMASIRNLSKSNNGSSAQLFRVTSFSDKSEYILYINYYIYINEDPRNLEVKLNLPLFKDTYNKKSNSFLNINYPINNSNDYSKKRSIIVKPGKKKNSPFFLSFVFFNFFSKT